MRSFHAVNRLAAVQLPSEVDMRFPVNLLGIDDGHSGLSCVCQQLLIGFDQSGIRFTWNDRLLTNEIVLHVDDNNCSILEAQHPHPLL
ncbi:hypothetical protein D3C71_1872520 [compost metagenome]